MVEYIFSRFVPGIVLKFGAAAAAIIVSLALPNAGFAASKVDPSATPPANGTAIAAEAGSFDRNSDGIADALMARIQAGSPADQVDVVVTFNEQRSAAAAMAQVGPFDVKREFTLINGFSATMRAAQVQALAASPSVFRIDENFEMQAVLDAANADTGASDARSAFGVDGTGVTICVIDTGLEATHEQFDSKTLGPGDFFDAIAGLGVPYDDNFHGTHVAGIAAGDGAGPSSEASLFGGFAPGASLKIAKVLDASGNGISDAFIAGVEWCAGQADVDIISASISTAQAGDGLDSTSIAVNCAADPTWSGTCGVIGGEPKITVIAAGNIGARPTFIGSPGAAELAITVGAFAEWSAGVSNNWHDDGVYLNAFSSRGPVMAGGVAQYIKPDIVGPGSRVASAVPFALFNQANAYGIASGTSMATPSISGIIALMLQADPTLAVSGGTPSTLPVNKIRDILALTAIDRGEPGLDNEWGAGIVDAFAAVSYATDPAQPLPAPTPMPAYTRLTGQVVPDAPGQWFHEFTIDATNVNFPVSAVVTIQGGMVCALGAYPFCFAEEWGPDIEARLDYFDAGLGAWGAAPASAGFGPVTLSTCPLATAPATDGCGTWGRVETIHFAPSQTGLYRIALYAFTGSPNNGLGGTVDFEFTMGPLDGTPPLPNTAPVANNDAATTDEDVAAIGIDVLFNDTDADSDPLTVTSLTQPTNGSAVINGDETITYTPNPNFNGADSFTYTANDGTDNSNVATVDITVDPINDPPVASFTFICGGLDCNFDALPGSVDPDGSITSYTWNFGDGNGDTGSAVNHSYAADGTYNVSLTVFDNDGDFDAQLQGVSVAGGAPNNPPTFDVDPITGAAGTEGQPYADTIAGTASDPDAGDTLTYSKAGGPAWLTVAGDGTLGGTPGALDAGANVFTVQVSDGTDSDTAPLNITVNAAPNNPPTFDVNPITGAAATEDQAYADSIFGTASDSDAGDTLTYSKTGGPGWLNIAGGGTLSGTPGALDVGANVFTVQVSDGTDTDTATLNITVNAALPPDSPAANDDLALMPSGRNVVIDVLANDTGSGLSVLSVTTPANGTATVNADDTITYKRDKSFRDGCDTFTYTATNASGSDSALVQVSVGSTACVPAGNSAPVANDDSVTTDINVPTVITLTATDADGDLLTYAIDGGPTNGSLSGTPPNITYTPNTTFVGSDSVTFHANDGTADSNVATVSIQVVEPGSEPTTVHVADLDGLSVPASGNKWRADVVVTVHDNLGSAVSGAGVSGAWSNGANGTGSCTTDGSGQCTISKGGLRGNVASVTFTMNGISGSLAYDSGSNTDPDADSDGTTIILTSP